VIDRMQRADSRFTGDPDARLYTEPEIRARATHVIELLPPSTAPTAPRGRDDYPQGLLAALEDDGAVSVVAFRFHSGTSRDRAGQDVYPPVYEVLFSGTGYGAPLRELRHTDWGEDGYINYPDGRVIAEAFRHLARWFDDCWEASDAPAAEPCPDNKHALLALAVGTRCACGLVVVCDDGVRAGGRLVDPVKMHFPSPYVAGEWTFDLKTFDLKSAPRTIEPCCERDNDGDGNCDIHSAKGVLRGSR